MPENMQPENWNALKKIADKGKVNVIIMSEPTLKSANDIQLQALWKATRDKIGCWWDCTNNRTFAMKTDGDLGLQKILGQKTSIMKQNKLWNFTADLISKRGLWGICETQKKAAC